MDIKTVHPVLNTREVNQKKNESVCYGLSWNRQVSDTSINESRRLCVDVFEQVEGHTDTPPLFFRLHPHEIRGYLGCEPGDLKKLTALKEQAP